LSANSNSAPPPLLEMRAIRKAFVSRGFLASTRRVVAAEDVSFTIRRGESVALVGESGSGKSTIARLLVRLDRPDAGAIRLNGDDMLAREPRRASLAFRSRVQMVFQDPFSSLNSVHTIEHHLVRPLRRHGRAGAGEARGRAAELLRTVGLEPAEEFLGRRPDELSGGQRQRVASARALAVDPELLVADEPTSMLDVSIRMGVLNLLAELKRERGLAILLITHDLASARYLADRILVLFRGRVVEDGPSDAVVASPAHPYTRALLASIAGAERVPSTSGTSSAENDGAAIAIGCPFATRCPDVLAICREVDPAPRPVDRREVRCHLYAARTTVPEAEAR
jgi:peptide/nickel transport system ATP-binding protein